MLVASMFYGVGVVAVAVVGMAAAGWLIDRAVAAYQAHKERDMARRVNTASVWLMDADPATPISKEALEHIFEVLESGGTPRVNAIIAMYPFKEGE